LPNSQQTDGNRAAAAVALMLLFGRLTTDPASHSQLHSYTATTGQLKYQPHSGVAIQVA